MSSPSASDFAASDDGFRVGTSSANASDVGLIIQGTLILLSACVAVIGYYVQARLKSKERARELAEAKASRNTEMRLERLRSKIADFVGPASQQLLNTVTGFGYIKDKFKEFYPDESKRWQDEREKDGFTTKRMYGGHWNKEWTLLGPYVEKILKRKDASEGLTPEIKLHRNVYCMNMRSIVKKFVGPLSEVIQKYGQHLQHWGDKEEYKKRFPCAANNGLLRNLFPTQLCRWHAEFEEILEMWDRDDYSLLYPVCNPFPKLLIIHFMRMLTALRELENEAGIASHAVFKDDNGGKDSEKKLIEKKVSAALKKKKGKYAVVAATAGAVAGGVAASVVGKQ